MALGKPTAQSTNYDVHAIASKAVDGCADPSFWNGCCTHTQFEAAPWWGVDIGKTIRVGQVRILNREAALASTV